MFFIKEPSALKEPWILSHPDEDLVTISKEITQNLRNYHIMGIDFLYRSYRKKLNGIILNEEEDLGMQIQVAVFLSCICNCIKKQLLVLVVCPDDLLGIWHYYLSTYAGLKVEIITPSTCPEDFDEENGLAILLTFSNIKLAESLIGYEYFSVIIDDFDVVASKLIIRKLVGDFNIGLTKRSFYMYPDQKLQWTMLNWANPGCVGKLLDFFEVDNNNFKNFRDNYRYWWLRLTSTFCESFKPLAKTEKQEIKEKILKWSRRNNLPEQFPPVMKKKCRKRKPLQIVKEIDEDKTKPKIEKNTAKLYIRTEGKKRILCKKLPNEMSNSKEETDEQQKSNGSKSSPSTIRVDSKSSLLKFEDLPEKNSNSSSDTTIFTEVTEKGTNYVKLPSMDESPILTSIIKNFEKSPEPLRTSTFNYSMYSLNQPTCSKVFEDYGILMSIIDNKNADIKSESAIKKEEYLADILNEPSTSTQGIHSKSDDFLKSLIFDEETDKPQVEEDFSKIHSLKNSEDFLKSLEVNDHTTTKPQVEAKIGSKMTTLNDSDYFLTSLALGEQNTSTSQDIKLDISKTPTLDESVHFLKSMGLD